MATFTNTFCEHCGGPGTVLSADGWNLCMVHFVEPRPSRRSFDRETGEPIAPTAGSTSDERPRPADGPPVPASEIVAQPADPIPHDRSFGCQSFRVGHRVHWVQGLRSVNGGQDVHHVPCEITEVGEDGWFTLVLLDTGERKRRWHHSVGALHARVGLRLRVHEGYSIIRKVVGMSNPISISGEETPCVHEEATGPLHERMETHGGFSVSGPEALRLIAESDGSGAPT